MLPRAVEGEHEAKEVLNLVGGKDEAALVLREQILNNYFRELVVRMGASARQVDRMEGLRCRHQIEPVQS